MERKNESWKVNIIQVNNLYLRNRYIYDKFIFGRFIKENYRDKVFDLERRLLIAQGVSLEKLQVPLFLNSLYYFDDHIYFPYLSDLMRVNYSPEIHQSYSNHGRRIEHKKYFNYYEELIVMVYHLNNEELEQAYTYYLQKMLKTRDILNEKPNVQKYRKKARRLDYKERESVGRSIARFFFVIFTLFIMAPVALLTLLLTVSNLSLYGRENLAQAIFFLIIFLVPLPFYLLGRRRQTKVGNFEKMYFSGEEEKL